MKQEWLPRVEKSLFAVAAVAMAYYGLARIGLLLSLSGTASCPIWPASGFAVVAAVALGWEAGLGVFLGATLANAQALGVPPEALLRHAYLASAAIGLGSAAQALLGARILGPLLNGPETLARSRDVALFTALTPAVCLIGAGMGIASLSAAGMLLPHMAPRAWLTWWIGDIVGIMLVSPLLFAWKPRPSDEFGEPIHPRRALFVLAVSALLMSSVWLGFGEAFRLGMNYPLSFLPFTALIWVTLTLDSRGATASAALMAFLIHWYTLRGLGPFAEGRGLIDALLLSSAYVALATLTAYFLRAVIAERQAALAKVKAAQTALEHRISEQGEDLWSANATLRVAALARRQDGHRIQLYRRIVDELPSGIAVLSLRDRRDPDSWQIVEMNRAGQRLAAAADEDPVGKSLLEFAPEVRETDLLRACAEALNQNHDVEVMNFISTKRAPGRHFSIRVFPLGAPLVGIVFEDITVRRAAEAALARSNAELTQFAYVASHDLQAPLRKAAAFTEQIRLRLGERLDATNLDFLLRLGRSLEGMQALIDGLLQLARAAAPSQPAREVDLGRVAASVVADFEEQITSAGAVVRIDAMPVVRGDPSQMRQLLQNLIGNALKFRRPEAPVTIRVGGRVLEDSRGEFTVADDGAGFDMQFASRLFQPFQRLHSSRDYPGTGMGLAICRKIVDRHGGTISVDSAPGQGATFTVVLPDCRAPNTEELWSNASASS